MRLIAIMLTVITAGVVPGILYADDAPKRSPELQVLDRFVGTWDMKFTVKEEGGEKIAMDIVSIREWSLGGTFLRYEDANNLISPQMQESQILLTYDPKLKNYPGVTMDGPRRGQVTGTWDEKTQTFSLIAPFPDDVKVEINYRFISESRIEASGTVKDRDGKIRAEMSYNQTRREK